MPLVRMLGMNFKETSTIVQEEGMHQTPIAACSQASLSWIRWGFRPTGFGDLSSS